jgi:hypothetical protein
MRPTAVLLAKLGAIKPKICAGTDTNRYSRACFGFRSVRMRSDPLPRREGAGARDGRSCPTRNPRDESGVGRRTTVSGTGLEGNNWGDIRVT